MVEAVMLWNEPNNLSHWDFKIDPDWKMFAEMAKAGARAIRAINPEIKIVLGLLAHLSTRPFNPEANAPPAALPPTITTTSRNRCGVGAMRAEEASAPSRWIAITR